MINFGNVKFFTSCTTKLEDSNKIEVLFLGRSNVGKSSLINLLTNHNNLAFVSSKPGHTKLLNYFDVDDKFYLVDAPGFGYSATDKNFILEYEKMMDSYFDDNKNLKLGVLLIDSRRLIKEYEMDMFSYFKYKNIEFCIVFTKMDKLNQSEKAQIKKSIKENGLENAHIFYSRNDRIDSLNELKTFLSNYLNY